MRQEIFLVGRGPAGENLLSPFSWENLMSHAFSIYPMTKSHEIWDYLMRQKTGDFLIGVPPHKKVSCLTRKSHVSCILDTSHEKILWDMKYSHETGDRRFSPGGPHEKISCLMGKFNVSCFLHKSHEKILWHVKFSHETGDRRFPPGGPPWENLLSHEKI